MNQPIGCRPCILLGLLISASLHVVIAAVLLGFTAPQPVVPDDRTVALTLAMFGDGAGETAGAPEPAGDTPTSDPSPQSPPASASDTHPTPLPDTADAPPQPVPTAPIPEVTQTPMPVARSAPMPLAPPPPVPLAQSNPVKPSIPAPAIEARKERKTAREIASKPKPKPKRTSQPTPKIQRDRPPVTPARTVSTPTRSASPTQSADDGRLSKNGGIASQDSAGIPGARNEGTPGSRAAGERQYLAALQRAIARHQRYPMDARRKQQTGIVTVAFVVHADGRIRQARIAKSSGQAALDQAALEALRRLDRFEPIPPSIGRQTWPLQVPIRFDLR